MKKKIVRLTESDLVRIVKKVINEQSSGAKQVAGPYNVKGTQLSYYIFDNNGKFFIYQTNASVKEPTLMKGTVWNNNGPGYDTQAQAYNVIKQQLSSNNNNNDKQIKESNLVRIVKRVINN